MRRVACLAVLVLTILGSGGTALADEGEQGAVPPPVADPAGAARNAEKLARIQAAVANETAGSVITQLTGRQTVTITADDIGPDYASLDMPVWMEPQSPYKYAPGAVYPYNWCGPGTTSGVVSRWIVMFGDVDPVPNYPAHGIYPAGKDAYQNHLAYDLGEVANLGDADPWTDFTTYDQMIYATNLDGSTGGFYIQSNPLTLSSYISLLYADLHDSRVPLIPVVNTNGLPGWGTRSVNHWVSVKQFWQGGNTTTYGDSAGPIQGSGSTYGWHVVRLDWFYGRIAAAYNSVVW